MKKKIYIIIAFCTFLTTEASAQQQVSFGPLHSPDSPREEWLLPGDTVYQAGKPMIYQGKPVKNAYMTPARLSDKKETLGKNGLLGDASLDSTYYCLSQPIAALFAAQYPQDAEAMAAAFYQRRPTAIRVNPLRTTDEALTQTLQQEGHTVTAGPWPHCLLVMFNGNPAASKAFHAGQFHVQGLASQFAALCCDAHPGMRVLDLCAAPGGKSLTIAEQMQDRGELFSGEAMTGRVKLLKQAFDRCGIERAKPYHGDATILNLSLIHI